MLKYNLHRLFKQKGITKPSAFLTNSGFTRNVAARLALEKVKTISPANIEKLCFIFKCTPNDLMEWTPKDEAQLNANLFLARLLSSSEPIFDLRNIGEEIPYEKISEFAKKVNALKKEILAAK